MRKWKQALSILLCMALLAGAVTGCKGGAVSETGQTEALQETDRTIEVTDQAGRKVTLNQFPESLVSSYYISTAILIALGCEEELKGIEMKADTRELYRLAAPGLLELPAVGSGKGINVEETAALEPDLVILPARLSDSVASFEELDIPVLVVNPETQEDFEECVSLLAEVTGKQDTGEELLGYYREKMEEAENLTKDLEKPRVYLASGSDYLRTCTSNMYQDDLIRMAGGENVSSKLQDGYWQTVSPEEILNWNPEYIFAVNYAEYLLEDITGDPALEKVQAVEKGNVFTFPSQIEAWDYPTPSSVLGVLWLTYQLHPQEYTKEQYVEEAQNFYQRFFDISVTETQLGL